MDSMIVREHIDLLSCFEEMIPSEIDSSFLQMMT